MTRREQFLSKNQRFFDSGYVKEIYGNENISIMNVCNSLYVASQYSHDENSNYSGCIVDVEHVKKIITDNNILPIWINNMSNEELKKVIMQFNDRTYEIMRTLKEKTDTMGPTVHVDLSFEESLIEKQK